MNTTKIRTGLHLDNVISKRKVNKLVTILNTTIPGNSYETLLEHKRDIAIFARKNGLSNVTVYDPRTQLGEFFGSIESRMMSCVDIQIKNKNGLSIDNTMDFFEAPRSEFMPRVFNKLTSMSEFFTKKVKPEINIDEAVLKKLSPKEIQELKAKALKSAEKMKISNIEISVVDNKYLQLELKRVYNEDNYSSRTSPFKDGIFSTKEVIARIKDFDGVNGINKIST